MYQQFSKNLIILRAIPLVLPLLSRNCPLRKQIKQLFSSFLSLFFLLCPLFRKDSVKSLKIWNLKFVFILKWIDSLNRFHDQYLLKLLTVSFCFFNFWCQFSYCQIYYIYIILVCKIYMDNCIVFQLLFRNKMLFVIRYNHTVNKLK